MLLKDTASIYTKKRTNDGYGGHIEKEVFLTDIKCKKQGMTVEKQQVYFGQLSKTALSLITKDCINEDCIIEIDNKKYEIVRKLKVFNKYVLDIEVLSNV